MALGTHSLGVHDYYVCLFTHLGICVTPDVRHYLMKQQQARARRIVTHKKKEVKLRRIEKLHKKLKEHTEELQCIICKKEGSVYQPGIGVDAGICLPTSDVATKASLKACSSCNQIGAGHVRPWSEKCSNYKEYMLSCSKKPVTGTEVDTVSVSEQEALFDVPTLEDTVHQDAKEQGLLYQVVFNEDADHFFDALEDEAIDVDSPDAESANDMQFGILQCMAF